MVAKPSGVCCTARCSPWVRYMMDVLEVVVWVGWIAGGTKTVHPCRPRAVGSVRSEAEIGSGGAVPARCDVLGAGVEAPGCVVQAGVSVGGVLPTLHRVGGHRDRDRDIHPDHSGGCAALEFVGGGAVSGEDRGTVTVAVVLDQAERVVEGVHPMHDEHRTEKLLLVRRGRDRDVGEHGGTDEVAVVEARHLFRCCGRALPWPLPRPRP